MRWQAMSADAYEIRCGACNGFRKQHHDFPNTAACHPSVPSNNARALVQIFQ
jgi:hypothetical protein